MLPIPRPNLLRPNHCFGSFVRDAEPRSFLGAVTRAAKHSVDLGTHPKGLTRKVQRRRTSNADGFDSPHERRQPTKGVGRPVVVSTIYRTAEKMRRRAPS